LVKLFRAMLDDLQQPDGSRQKRIDDWSTLLAVDVGPLLLRFEPVAEQRFGGEAEEPLTATPYTFWLKARGFLEFTERGCSDSLTPSGYLFGVVGTVPYYVVCMAIELALKAYLLRIGLRPRKLQQRFGHDLAALYKRCAQHGIEDRLGDLAPHVQSMIQYLSPVHETRWLGYPEGNTMATLPRIGDVLRWTEGLLQAITDDCRYEKGDDGPAKERAT